jgi:hypothetical protein
MSEGVNIVDEQSAELVDVTDSVSGEDISGTRIVHKLYVRSRIVERYSVRRVIK